jgi:hypothetical protein
MTELMGPVEANKRLRHDDGGEINRPRGGSKSDGRPARNEVAHAETCR